MKKSITCKSLVQTFGWNGSAFWEAPGRSVDPPSRSGAPPGADEYCAM